MLSAALKPDFVQRSGTAVEDAFSLVAANWKSNRWLNAQSRYSKDCIRKLTIDFGPNGRLHHKHLREYVAASVLVHCVDGWAFLGRALAAQLVGDHDAARHLGYYAELRAAMTVLGAHGVGVFSSEHAVVTIKGRCIRIARPRNQNRPTGPGTHEFVWNALEEWTNSADASDAILGCINVGGECLKEWLSHFASTPALSGMLAQRWLLSWGLDIARLAKDRDARNLSSYRPTAFSTSRPPLVGDSLRIILSLWSSCEPSTDSPFSNLDRQLLRASLREAFKVTHNLSPKRAKLQFKLRVQSLFHYLKPATTAGADLEAYLTNADKVPDSILEMASRQDKPDSPEHSLQVVSRALLLLRVATGACARFVDTLPMSSRGDLNFWIEQIGQDSALWRPGETPSSLRDLWKDPEDALRILAGDSANITSYSELWRRQALAASILSTCERVGLWGIAA